MAYTDSGPWGGGQYSGYYAPPTQYANGQPMQNTSYYGQPSQPRTTMPVAQQAPPSGGGASTNIEPQYLSQLFPNGIPQTNVALDPTQEINAVLQNLDPTFKQQDSAMQDALANAGIVGGSTTGAMGNLAGEQTQEATAATAPLMQAAQQMQLQQAEGNTANKLTSGEFDASTFNQMLAQMLGFQNSDWLAELGAQSGLAEAGAGAQSGAFQPVFTQPTTPNFMDFGSAFAPYPGGSSGPYPSAPGWGIPGQYGGV